MYEKTEWVNGEMCTKYSPNGEWFPWKIKDYQSYCQKLENKNDRLQVRLQETKDLLQKAIDNLPDNAVKEFLKSKLEK